MIHQEIRAGFEASFSAALNQTKPIEALYSALTQHRADVEPQYHALSDALDFDGVDPAYLNADLPEGSLGASLGGAPMGVASVFLGAAASELHEKSAALLIHIGHISEAIRAVLDYPRTTSGDISLHAFIAQQAPNKASYLAIAAWLGRAAFTDPEATKSIYDALACGWRDGSQLPGLVTADWAALVREPLDKVREDLGVTARGTRFLDCPPVRATSLEPAALSAGLPDLLWALVNTPEKALDPYQITTSVAGLGAGFDGTHFDAVERTLLSFEGMAEVTATTIPQTVKIEDLANMPVGSLGQTFYRLITDNNFDVEVLDPTQLFGQPEPDMRPGEWMNRRILQLHDVIHLVAGYQQTGEDEVAISGFQLAQIGQNYSACFIATTCLISTLYFPAGFAPLINLSLDGWAHGRQTKPLVLVDWESLWPEQITKIRDAYGIAPFTSEAGSLPGLAAD